MSSGDEAGPPPVTSVADFARALRNLRIVRLDTLSFAKMEKRCGNAVSRAEFSRIFSGSKLPSRAQLSVILELLDEPADAQVEWGLAWERLALADSNPRPTLLQDGVETGPPAGPRHARSEVDGPTVSLHAVGSGVDGPTVSLRAVDPGVDDDIAAMQAATRKAAENARDSILAEAVATAKLIVDRAFETQQEFLQQTEKRMEVMATAIDSSMRSFSQLIEDAGASSDQLKTLMDTVHESVAVMRREITDLRTETRVHQLEIEKRLPDVIAAPNPLASYSETDSLYELPAPGPDDSYRINGGVIDETFGSHDDDLPDRPPRASWFTRRQR